jgi:hypothetical protein
MEDYDIDYDVHCPYCGKTPLHSRNCDNWCEDGYFDEYEYDPINFLPGEELTKCDECNGTGVVWWCPSCGKNLSGDKKLSKQFRELEELQNPD